MEEKNSIFRKDSLDRIASPEQVDDYIRIASPGVWFVLAAVLLLLAGLIAWGFAGRLETRLTVQGVSAGGSAVVVLPEEQAPSLQVGARAYSGACEGEVTGIERQEDELAVAVRIPELPDGAAEITLVIESVPPISFLL